MKTSLNYSWKFVPDFKEEYLNKLPSNYKEVNIPHNAFEVPYNYFKKESYQNVVTYEKEFEIKKINPNKKYLLKFDGFMFKAHIYLNNVDLGIFVSGYLPIEIDISSYIKENNRLLIILDSKEDPNYPPFGFVIDYVTFSGIYREVYLLEEPLTYLRNIYPHGDIDGNLTISYDIIGDKKVNIHHELYFENNLIKSFKENETKIDDFKPWDIDHPNLYLLKTYIEIDNEVEVYDTRFGFRDIKFNKDGFYLNNKRIKLIGLNRHQGYPYIGYAASKSLQIDDANLLKYELGVNVVRTSHYPQSEHFLSRSDEIGLLVINEIPGWQHLGESETWKNECIKNTKNMVLTERHHPCLIAHGVRVDESIDNHELYEKTNQIAHKFDKYRPTIGVRNFSNSELLEDIYGYNDFIYNRLNIGLINPKKIKHGNKGYLITEYMGHMDPVKASSDETKRIEVALKHARIIDDNLKYDSMAGAIGWCFVDYHTHTDFGSGDNICPHGVLDLYRNPKYTSYIYASQQDKTPVLELLSNFKPGDIPEAVFNDLYIATNCDYVELYKNDELVYKFYPNKKQYKYLKHPPILIDDIVGYTFKEDKIPQKKHLKIAKMFSYAAMHGFNHLPLRMSLYLGYTMLRYKLKYSDLVGYWNKYVGAWGGKAKTYKFVGYINNKPVKEVIAGPNNEYKLEVTSNKTELINEDTYDTLRIKVRHTSGYGQLLQYSTKIVSIETKGPIELIGPSQQTLLGGQLSIYIKSINKKGPASIIVKLDDLIKTINIEVK